jgi:hypothetical protein
LLRPVPEGKDQVVTEPPSSPLEAALDLLVYVPVGLAVTLTEEVPKLAAKGRERIGGRIAVARLVGQFAVGQGRRMVADSMGNGAGAGHDGTRPTTRPAGPTSSTSASAPGAPATPSPARPVTPSPVTPAPSGATPAPAVSTLAIPGYDSLSASQVVQRLAGLSQEELDAVGHYEAAGRGRRTILARVTQLQAR